MSSTIERKVYDIKEVSQILGMSKQQVYRLVRENHIPYKRVGRRRILFPKQLLHEWINKVDY